MKVSGVLWILASSMLFSSMGATLKVVVIDGDTNVFWVGWIRFVVGVLSMLIPALLGFWSLRVINRKAFLFRGFWGAIGQFLLYAAIAYVGLGRGTVLTYLMVGVAVISAWLILAERPSRTAMFGCCLGLVGVFLGCEGGFPMSYEWLGLGAAIGSGLAITYIRLLRRTDSSQVIFLSQGIFGSLLLIPFLFHAPFPQSQVWSIILLLCLLDIGGQLCLNQGLGTLSVSRSAILMLLSPILSLLAGNYFLEEVLSSWQWAGCALVLLASVLSSKRDKVDSGTDGEYQSESPSDSQHRVSWIR